MQHGSFLTSGAWREVHDVQKDSLIEYCSVRFLTRKVSSLVAILRQVLSAVVIVSSSAKVLSGGFWVRSTAHTVSWNFDEQSLDEGE